MRVSDVHVTAVGVELPPVVDVATAVANGWYDEQEAVRTGLTGAAVAGNVAAPDLAVAAARQALARAAQDPAGLELLLYADVYHAGPEGWSPQAYLQRELDCGHVLAAGIRQGCNGVFGAMELAAAYLSAPESTSGGLSNDPVPGRRAALVVAADNLSSPLLDRWRVGPGVIMGDAGSALVLSRGPGFARLLSVGSATIPQLEGLHRGAEPLHPAGITLGRSLDFTSRFVEFTQAGGFGEDGALLFVKTVEEVVGRLLDEAGIELAAVTRVAYTNGSRQAVEERLAPLGVPLSLTTWDHGRGVGHLGASDQLEAFDHLLTAGELVPGDHLLMLGLGPGVSIAGAVLQVLERPTWVSR